MKAPCHFAMAQKDAKDTTKDHSLEFAGLFQRIYFFKSTPRWLNMTKCWPFFLGPRNFEPLPNIHCWSHCWLKQHPLRSGWFCGFAANHWLLRGLRELLVALITPAMVRIMDMICLGPLMWNQNKRLKIVEIKLAKGFSLGIFVDRKLWQSLVVQTC